MIPAILEKGLWMLTLAILFAGAKVTPLELAGNAATHGVLGILFGIAYAKTKR